MSVIDAHFHIWRPERGDYGWLTPEVGPICRDVTLDHWRAMARPCGVSGGVIVQAAPTEAETHFLLDCAEGQDDVLGVVGWADMLAPDAAQRIATLAQRVKLKGLRPMLQDIADPHWVLQEALAPAFKAMLDHGLVFDALVLPVHLPVIRELAARYPSLPMVIDHGAKPRIGEDAFDDWAEGMARLAAVPQIVCKLSGLLTEAGPMPDPARVQRYMRHILALFGPQRVLFGSDWPVLELAGDYAGWIALARETVPQADHAAVFGGNARRVYGL